MNIDEHFDAADVYLEMANEKFARQDYEGSLTDLAKAFAHTRALLEQVFKLQALKVEVESSAGENTT